MQCSLLRFGQLLKTSGLRTNYTKFSKPLYTRVGPRFRFCTSSALHDVARPATNYGRVFGYVGGFGILGAASYQGYSYFQYATAVPVQIIAPIEPPSEEFVHPYHAKPWYWRMFMKLRRLCFLCYLFTPVTLLCIGAQFTDDPDWRQWFLDKLVGTLERSGCSFQKFAQWMSMRPDIVPADVCEALGRMCNETVPHSFEHTQKEIRDCFGKEIDEIFEEFDPVAVASGSVAQVHKARLRPEFLSEGGPGLEVAVKVRHPNVLMEVYADLDILFSAVDLVSMFSQLSIPFDHTAWKKLLRQQMDFNWEAYNMQKFQQYFKGEKHVKFPSVSSELLSESVLVESWMPGKTVSEILSMFGDKYDDVKGEFSEKTKKYAKNIHNKFSAEVRKKKKHLAKIVFDVNMKMFVRDNFAHGDLHAGNVIWSEEDDAVTVIDTGLVTKIGSDYSNEFGMFLHALCTGNKDAVAKNLISFTVTKPYDDDKFMKDLGESVSKFCVAGTTRAPGGGPVCLGELLGDILNTLQRNGVQLRGDVATNIVTMSVSEGLIRRLDPDFDVVKNALPYFVRYRAWRKADLHTTVDQEKRATMNSPFGKGDSGGGFHPTSRKDAAYT